MEANSYLMKYIINSSKEHNLKECCCLINFPYNLTMCYILEIGLWTVPQSLDTKSNDWGVFIHILVVVIYLIRTG